MRLFFFGGRVIAGYRHGERVEREPTSPAPEAESFFRYMEAHFVIYFVLFYAYIGYSMKL